MDMHESYDAVVIGGGPAGLQATLTLARVHRRVLMVDSGSYRNDPASHMHNVVTHDGTPPAEFRAAARKELAAYETVTLHDGTVTSVAQDAGGGFLVAVGDQLVRSRGVMLTTGVVDTLPDKPGLRELFGSVVAHCRSATATSSPAGTSASSGPPARGTCPGWSRRSRRASPSTPTARASPPSCRTALRSGPTGSPACVRARSAPGSASTAGRPRRSPASSWRRRSPSARRSPRSSAWP